MELCSDTTPPRWLTQGYFDHHLFKTVDLNRHQLHLSIAQNNTKSATSPVYLYMNLKCVFGQYLMHWKLHLVGDVIFLCIMLSIYLKKNIYYFRNFPLVYDITFSRNFPRGLFQYKELIKEIEWGREEKYILLSSINKSKWIQIQ